MDGRRFASKKKLVRRRYAPYRKWSDSETWRLVHFLKDNNIQKPSGRKFYERFLNTYNLNIDWSLVKNKVRNMKTIYQKAKDWLSSQETQDVDALASTLERICPHYFHLEEIFDRNTKTELTIDDSSSVYNSTLGVEEVEGETIKISFSPPTSPPGGSGDSQHVPSYFDGNDQDHTPPILIKAEIDAAFDEPQEPSEELPLVVEDSSINQLPTRSLVQNQSTNQTNIKVTSSNEKVLPEDPLNISKKCETKTEEAKTCCRCQETGISNSIVKDLLQMLVTYQMDKRSVEKANHDLEERKFAFEREKSLRELDLKQKEIEKNERIQIMTLESNERIAMQELKFKYNDS